MWQIPCSTPFGVVAVTARTANELYVGGINSAGEFVVERWYIRARLGEMYQTRDKLTTSIGVAGTPTEPAETYIKGGTYIPVSTRKQAMPPIRETIFKAVLPSPVSESFIVDPDGRFMLIGAGDPRVIYQLAIDGTNTFSPVTSPGTVPADQEPSPNLIIMERKINGSMERAIVTGMVPLNSIDVSFLSDFDNDGVFLIVNLGGLDLMTAFPKSDGWEFYPYY